MGRTPGDIPGQHFRRYSLPELVAMGFADSPEDAEANELQWRRLGDVLLTAAESASSVARELPESYRSPDGAPAMLDRLEEAAKSLQGYGQIALDNGTAWMAVKQSLERAQTRLAVLDRLSAGGSPDSVRNTAADVVDRLSLDYINYANEILPPDTRNDGADGNPAGPGDDIGTTEVYGSGSEGGDRVPGQPVAGSGMAPWGPAGGPSYGVPGGPGGGARTPPGAPASGSGPGSAPAGKAGATPGTIGAVPVTGAGGTPYQPIGRTLGGKAPAGAPGAGAPRPAGPVEPTAGRPGTGPGAPTGGTPPGTRGGGRDQRRKGRRRGGLLGDPNDFRYDADVVAPPEIHPDEQKPVADWGVTIGGGRKETEAESYAVIDDIAERARVTGRPASPKVPDVLPDDNDAPFRLRRGGGA